MKGRKKLAGKKRIVSDDRPPIAYLRKRLREKFNEGGRSSSVYQYWRRAIVNNYGEDFLPGYALR